MAVQSNQSVQYVIFFQPNQTASEMAVFVALAPHLAMSFDQHPVLSNHPSLHSHLSLNHHLVSAWEVWVAAVVYALQAVLVSSQVDLEGLLVPGTQCVPGIHVLGIQYVLVILCVPVIPFVPRILLVLVIPFLLVFFLLREPLL